ncbi:hypothetical protein [Pedobacter sp. MC2016-24]|uniref:hypothetical protein n=1 Tax=Pedobacter sp. MC2016-24 TaxID=2780090 RepID=UPI0018825B50|nr:hypothetical protein [Pedobacter sp. MC2016-24]MBE9601470.1 hypothetical protein [Pedobacter sp. MC2016-24]
MKIDSKYNGIVLAVFVLLIIVVVVVVRGAKTNYYTIIMDAQIRGKNDDHFKDCYLKWNGNNYLITDYYRYKNDDLIEYKSATSSGFAVFNLTDSNSFYNGSRDRYKKLWYKQKSDNFELDNEKFKIDYINKDTVVSNIDGTFIKVVIQKFVD